jgi:hypothetical protein
LKGRTDCLNLAVAGRCESGGRRGDRNVGFVTDDGEDVMVRTVAITLAAAALTAGSILSAEARNMGHAGMSTHAGSMNMAPRNMGPTNAGPGNMGSGHMWMGHHDHDHFRFGHRRFFHGRFFAFAPYDDDACRVWTPYGWRWSYACYYNNY